MAVPALMWSEVQTGRYIQVLHLGPISNKTNRREVLHTLTGVKSGCEICTLKAVLVQGPYCPKVSLHQCSCNATIKYCNPYTLT